LRIWEQEIRKKVKRLKFGKSFIEVSDLSSLLSSSFFEIEYNCESLR